MVYADGSFFQVPNVFVGTLYESDGGTQWNQLSQAGFTSFGLVVDPFSPSGSFYRSGNFTPPHTGAYSSQLSRSADAGATWFESDSGLGLGDALDHVGLVADRSRPAHLDRASSTIRS